MVGRPLALVTGATSGIGRAFAVDYARRGCDVMIVARTKEALDSLAQELSTQYSIACHVCVADLSTVDGVLSMLRDCDAIATPDAIVVNAGVTRAASVGSSQTKDVEDLMTLLALGPMLAIEHFAPKMVERRSGDIIVVSSIASVVPMPKSAVYAAAKSAATSYARSVHRELRDSGVRVVAVNPGYVRTGLHRAAGLAHLERVVPKWLWLEPTAVVSSARRGLDRGRDSVIPGVVYRVSRPFLSSSAAQSLWRRIVRPKRITR